MAEAVGLAASILALAGLAKIVIKLAKEARSFAHDFKIVRTELRGDVRHVYFSAKTIYLAQNTFRKYSQKETQSISEVIKFIRENHVLDYIHGQSQHIGGQVQRLLKKILSLRDRHTLWVTWEWRRSLRKQIERLRVQMQFIQVGFTLLLETILFEIAINQERTDEVYIEHLKHSIGLNEKLMHQLGKERTVLDFKSDVDTVDSPTESLLFDHEAVKAVLKLAMTIREEETVPHVYEPVRLRRPRSDGERMNVQRSRAEAAERKHAEEQRQEGDFQRPTEDVHAVQRDFEGKEKGRSRREDINAQRSEQKREGTTRSRPRIRHSHPFSRYIGSDRPEPNRDPPEPPNAPNNRPRSRRTVEDHNRKQYAGGSNNEVASRNVHGDSSGRSRATNLSGTSASSQQRERNAGREGSEYMSVRALPEILQMEASHSAQAVQGCIEDGNGKQRLVTAIVERKQKFNLMSANMASELSLLKAIKQYTGEEGVKTSIQTISGGPIKPLGRVMVQWGTIQHPNAFSLEVWVAPYILGRELVLGEQFVSKSDYYVKRTGA